MPSEKPIEDKQPGTTAQVRDFLVRAAAGNLVESDFAFLWGGFSQKAGGRIRTLLERCELGDNLERRYFVKFDKATADVRIQFTADGKVSDFSVQPP